MEKYGERNFLSLLSVYHQARHTGMRDFHQASGFAEPSHRRGLVHRARMPRTCQTR